MLEGLKLLLLKNSIGRLLSTGLLELVRFSKRLFAILNLLVNLIATSSQYIMRLQNLDIYKY